MHATQPEAQYLDTLKELLHQSELIREEVRRHSNLHKFSARIGGIKQQLEFIREHILSNKKDRFKKHFKHHKLAVKLIEKHLAELEDKERPTQEIDELRTEILHNVAHIEVLLSDIKEHQHTPLLTQDITHYITEVNNLNIKAEILLKELKLLQTPEEPQLHEQIQQIHDKLQHIKLQDLITKGSNDLASFLKHHYHAIHDTVTHMNHLNVQFQHILENLDNEKHALQELHTLQDEIKHTIQQYEAKLEQLEQERLHVMQYPGAHVKPIPFKVNNNS